MKKLQWCMLASFLIFIVGISAAGLFGSDRSFSENENRYLAETPRFSWERVVSGRFQEDLEDYLNDQIAGRDRWITIKTAVQKVAGNTDIGGAYVGKDGYDFEKITKEDVDEKQFARNLTAVRDFFDGTAGEKYEGHMSFLLVPTSGYVLQDKLPDNARLFDQGAYMDRVKAALGDDVFVDVREELLAHNKEYIYYRTDHHWTMDGAYIAYEKWCRDRGYSYTGREQKKKIVLSEDFRGSLYSKILDADSAYDEIWVYALDEDFLEDDRYEVTIDEKKSGVVFDKEKLSEKDQYKFFFGDNYGQVHITHKEGAGKDAQRSILVIKDSFANTFVPLLLDNFDQIYMLDLRYYNGNVSDYLAEHEITDILVLYNISNFISDKNIGRL